MKSIHKFSALFFVSTIVYGFVTHNFIDNKEGSRVLFDPEAKLVKKDQLADKFIEKIFRDSGTEVQKKEDIELGIDFLKSKLKKQDEIIIAQKKVDNNVYEVVVSKLDNLFKNNEEINQNNVVEQSKPKIIVKKEVKLPFINDAKKPSNTKKTETVNYSKDKIYEFSNNDRKVNIENYVSKPKNQNKNSVIASNYDYKLKNQNKNLVIVSTIKNQGNISTIKNKNLNEYYEANKKIEVASYDKNKFNEKVQQIEMTRLERNKKLNDEF
jgi:hypothetical protein